MQTCCCEGTVLSTFPLLVKCNFTASIDRLEWCVSCSAFQGSKKQKKTKKTDLSLNLFHSEQQTVLWSCVSLHLDVVHLSKCQSQTEKSNSIHTNRFPFNLRMVIVWNTKKKFILRRNYKENIVYTWYVKIECSEMARISNQASDKRLFFYTASSWEVCFFFLFC